jgi:hypothetical protein
VSARCHVIEWTEGAALLAKLWSCGCNCVGFGRCAAWVGLTIGLDTSKSDQIRGLVWRIEVAGASILNAEARILLADAISAHGWRFRAH